MTVRVVAGPAQDDDLVKLANYALTMIKESPCIKAARDVTPLFVLDLAVTVFGISIIPFPDPHSPRQELENFAAIVEKLSVEIDADLSHIAPAELQLGKRRSLLNYLELLTAFIVYCVRNDLLDFELESSGYKSEGKWNENDGFVFGTGSGHTNELEAPSEFMDFHLSTSPELPRSVNRICPTLTSLQQHMQSTPASPGKTDIQIYSKDDQLNLQLSDKQIFRPQLDFTPNALLLHRRHPSLLTMQTDVSPPATPKDVDDILEIKPTNSPVTTAPSLRCSPVFLDSKKTQFNIDPTLINVSNAFPFTDSQMQPNPSESNKLDDLLSQSSTSSVQSPKHLSSSSQCLGILSDLENCPLTSDSLSHPSAKLNSSYKHSSSTSGRGRSPTPTAPGISNTSAPMSLIESLRSPKSVVLPNQSFRSSKSSNYIDLRHSKRNTSSNLKQSHPSLDSFSTNSILAWDRNVPDPNISRSKTNIDDTDSSFLPSFTSGPLESPFLKAKSGSSSKTQILSCIEGLPQTLKQRLDYLWTIICRAHTEAEAVGTLVKTLEDIGLKNIGSYTDVRKPHFNLSRETSKNNFDVGHLEDILKKISNGIDTILKSISTRSRTKLNKNYEPCGICSSQRPVHCQRQSSKFYSPTSEYQYQWRHESQDSEFENLMKMRHKCMVRGLRLCLRQLSSNRSQEDWSCPA